jgi:hypothetical protein
MSSGQGADAGAEGGGDGAAFLLGVDAGPHPDVVPSR